MKVQALQFCSNCIEDVLGTGDTGMGQIEFTMETCLTECSQEDCANNHLDDYDNQIVYYEED